MKNKITLILVLAMIFSATTFATSNRNDKVSKYIETTFSRKFQGAKEVTWSISDGYVKASFKLDGQVKDAYYTKAGDYLGTGRNLLSTELPARLQADLKKSFTAGWISELFEFTDDEETTYFATVENGDQSLLLRSEDSYSWLIIKKTRKN